jgi:hypothetical protein
MIDPQSKQRWLGSPSEQSAKSVVNSDPANRASTETTLSFQPTAFVGRLPVSAFSVSAFQRFSARLRAYFRSGWAFLIPYLAAYLLYYVLKWPVNPADSGAVVSGPSSVTPGTCSLLLVICHWVPCLLHVYWGLHAVNVVLAVIALRAWWKEKHRLGDATPPSRSDSDGDEGVAAPSPLPPLPPVKSSQENAEEAEDRASDDLTQNREGAKEQFQSFVPIRVYSWVKRSAVSAFSFQLSALRSSAPTAHGAIACKQAPPASGFSFSAFQLSAFRAALQRLAPWFLLGLLFWIPGVYLEWPADPWEHYRRINEWSWIHAVGEHSNWTKSSYFLAYSLVGHIAPPTRQLFWLDFYYTGCCLLLCWQFYRLARALGLGERASMLFVILQSVLFGNNIFGFYRYYGISSSIFAQIGAVALIRIAVAIANQKFQIPNSKSQGTPAEISQKGTKDARAEEFLTTDEHGWSRMKNASLFARLCVPLWSKRSDRSSPPLTPLPPVKTSQELAEGAEGSEQRDEGVASPSPLSSLPSVRTDQSAPTNSHESTRIESGPKLAGTKRILQLFVPIRVYSWAKRSGVSAFSFQLSAFASAALAAFALLALIAFNHPQGLGIAGLGLAAVAAWRLIEWRRSMIWWLAAGALVLSVIAVLWFPRNPAIDQIYRRDGWLTSWYGFNVFAFRLPVGDRTLQIVGVIGLVNLAAGLLLLRRNRLVGWLTITPMVALSLPFIAIPFVNSLVKHAGVSDIITYQRMLFAIPPSLALVALLEGKFRVPRLKFQGTGAEVLQEVTEGTENGVVEPETPTAHEGIAPTTPLSPLPPVKSAQEDPGQRVSAFSFQSSAFSAARFQLSAFPILLFALSALLLVPANGPFYNRFWHALMVPPDDLTMKPVAHAAWRLPVGPRDGKHRSLVTTPAVTIVLGAISLQYLPYAYRRIGQSIVEPLNGAIAIALSSRPTIASKYPTLTHDPLAADPSAWTALGGPPPEFVTGIKDFRASSTALQNPPGRRSDVFISDPIPVDPTQNYWIEVSARQSVGTNAIAYLAVVWYSEGSRLLVSNIPAPAGAGNPAGWGGGTYSYFGLIGETAPTIWTTYRKSFGLGEEAAIPTNAKFIRVGALLNYNETPAATIQLTNVRLWRKSKTDIMADGAFSIDERLVIIAPASQMLRTYASQAGQASTHWPANQVATDLSGGAELAAAARAAGGSPSGSGSMIFDLKENAGTPPSDQ